MSKKDRATVLKAIGENVRHYRKKRDMTQQQLADECDFELRQLQRIELGEHNTGVFNLYIISKVLRVELSELVKIERLK